MRKVIVLIALFICLLGCQRREEGGTAEVTSQPTPETAVPQPTIGPTTETEPATEIEATIKIDTAASTASTPYILGTNVPAWLAKDRFENELFQARTLAAGLSLMRIPGGSWSNYYDWLACERGGDGIDDSAECFWPWAARPTDFLNFLQVAQSAAMYTINMNGTAKEAAALVAFFNGSVSDNTEIGVDVRGRDWGRVSDWAKLRSDNGNPDPIVIQYWEIGNELYAGNLDSGTDCTAVGWEEGWTCDGTEYVNGVGSGANRKEGYLEFRDAMRAVDPTILVGAVGIPFQSEWSNWGNEVIAAAGEVMDFYIIHQYAYFEPPGDYEAVLSEPHESWPAIMADVQAAFDEYADGRDIPVAVTEYNLFSVAEQDNSQLMTRLVNALFLADTIGQMMANGVQIAAHWDLANGQVSSGSDYGLVNADTYAPYPAYYTFRLWSQFGSTILPVTNALPADTTLSVYSGRSDENTITILAINKTEEAIEATIFLENSSPIESATADVLTGQSLDSQTLTFNGEQNPSVNFSNAPAQPININTNPFTYNFTPYSITLIQLTLEPVVSSR